MVGGGSIYSFYGQTVPNCKGGSGGGTNGATGAYLNSGGNVGTPGSGGTQTGGYSFGVGATGGTSSGR